MNEQIAALTDLALAFECAGFSLLLALRRAPRATVGLFGALSAAALCGALAHGAGVSFVRPLAFRLALVALGGASLLSAHIGAGLALSRPLARVVSGVAAASFAAYAVAILCAPRSFGFAVVASVPGFALLLLALARESMLSRRRAPLVAALGLATMLAAAGLQQLGVALHPVWLDANALFHVLDMLALALLFVGLGPSSAERARPEPVPC